MSILKPALEIISLKEENRELVDRINQLNIFRDMEVSKAAKEKYEKEKVEIELLKLQKEHQKLKEQYGNLEIENLSLRETLKIVL